MSRILIVEDEPSIALALEDDLRREGYETEVVGDGDAAVERGGAGAFDLILLDVMLPGARRVRGLPGAPARAASTRRSCC